jgi:hypothetical protein
MEGLGDHILDPIALHNCQFEVLNGWPQNLSKNLIMYQDFWAKLDHDLKLQFRSEKVRFRGLLRWRDSVTTFPIKLPSIAAILRALTDDLKIGIFEQKLISVLVTLMLRFLGGFLEPTSSRRILVVKRLRRHFWRSLFRDRSGSQGARDSRRTAETPRSFSSPEPLLP